MSNLNQMGNLLVSGIQMRVQLLVLHLVAV